MGLTVNLKSKLKIFFQMIKFEHTLFALPFAYLGLWLAEKGRPRLHIFLWVTIAMVAMRTAAMCFNRIVDRKIDSANPRTKDWALPKALLSVSSVWIGAGLGAILYFFSAFMLNRLCFVLSPIPFFLIAVYPYLKRFTWFCHFVLGMILGIAPAAGWIASRGTVSPECWLLFFAVLFWVVGFDMIYALQDVYFDRAYGLKSFPAKFDVDSTVQITRIFHLLTFMTLIALGLVAHLGIIYWMGLSAVLFFLVREHWLIARFGLAKIQQAFFQMNILVSGMLFFSTWLDFLWR